VERTRRTAPRRAIVYCAAHGGNPRRKTKFQLQKASLTYPGPCSTLERTVTGHFSPQPYRRSSCADSFDQAWSMREREGCGGARSWRATKPSDVENIERKKGENPPTPSSAPPPTTNNLKLQQPSGGRGRRTTRFYPQREPSPFLQTRGIQETTPILLAFSSLPSTPERNQIPVFSAPQQDPPVSVAGRPSCQSCVLIPIFRRGSSLHASSSPS